ncbi:hypothetical protein LSH36_353g00003 [Paralvinella palmiformis]|uniref:Uncharacterized protein n=1 Tax=Paralvinella palmiformis TaxID=53620 RepID=A0AAD9JFY7_9ANNE|nr:hypothetical protein LSH36_353g00003 [Paralvinella palmiformis]
MVQQKVTTTTTTRIEVVKVEMDGYFIGGMICVALGVILIIIAVVYLITWCCRIRKNKHQNRLRRRHLEHMRYLEEYSIKTGDSPNEVIKHNNNTTTPLDNEVFKWDQADLVNLGYVSDNTLERISQKGPKLDAHMNGSSSSFAPQRPHSRTGSSGSRPSSMTSLSQSIGADSSRLKTVSGKSQQRISNGTRDVEGKVRSDRLADVPV